MSFEVLPGFQDPSLLLIPGMPTLKGSIPIFPQQQQQFQGNPGLSLLLLLLLLLPPPPLHPLVQFPAQLQLPPPLQALLNPLPTFPVLLPDLGQLCLPPGLQIRVLQGQDRDRTLGTSPGHWGQTQDNPLALPMTEEAPKFIQFLNKPSQKGSEASSEQPMKPHLSPSLPESSVSFY